MDLVAGQKILAEELQKQQKSLVQHVEQQHQVLGRQQKSKAKQSKMRVETG